MARAHLAAMHVGLEIATQNVFDGYHWVIPLRFSYLVLLVRQKRYLLLRRELEAG
jgi:hypothetical protein